MRAFLALILASLLWSVPAPVAAQEPGAGTAKRAVWLPDRLYLPIGSQHINMTAANFSQPSWVEFNPGLILTWEDRGPLDLEWSLGGFRNSFGEISAYGGVAQTWQIWGGLRAGLTLGIADYGANARFFTTRIGTSGLVFTGGPQIEFYNAFLQLQPAGTQRDGRFGVVAVAGFTLPLP